MRRWRNELLKVLDPNGRLIVDLVPELELIMTTTPDPIRGLVLYWSFPVPPEPEPLVRPQGLYRDDAEMNLRALMADYTRLSRAKMLIRQTEDRQWDPLILRDNSFRSKNMICGFGVAASRGRANCAN